MFRTANIISSILFILIGMLQAQKPVFLGDIKIYSPVIPHEIKLKDNRLTPYNKGELERLSRVIQEEYSGIGYPYAEVMLKDVRLSETDGRIYLNPEFEINPGRLALIDSIIISGLKTTNPEFIRRMLNDLKGQPFRYSEMEKLLPRFERYTYLDLKEIPQLVRTSDDRFGILISMDEREGSEFSGILGYIPAEKGKKGILTGDMRIRFANISGWGREVSLRWQKPNRESQELNISVWYPFFFSTSFDAEFQFNQELRDTLFISRKFQTKLSRGGDFTVYGVYFEQERIDPTTGGKELLALEKEHLFRSGAEVKSNHFDLPRNPRRGYNYKFRFDAARKSPGLYVLSAVSGAEIVHKVHGNLFFFSGVYFRKIWQNRGELPFTQYFWIGGAQDLRGYREDFFAGNTIYRGTMELRYPFSRLSRGGVFADYALIRSFAHNVRQPFSYGFLLQLETRMGILLLNYGLGKGDAMSNGKIHLQLSTRF